MLAMGLSRTCEGSAVEIVALLDWMTGTSSVTITESVTSPTSSTMSTRLSRPGDTTIPVCMNRLNPVSSASKV